MTQGNNAGYAIVDSEGGVMGEYYGRAHWFHTFTKQADAQAFITHLRKMHPSEKGFTVTDGLTALAARPSRLSKIGVIVL